MLPAYWYFWRVPERAGRHQRARHADRVLTVIVWWNFLVGHIINNLRGFA